MSGRAQAAREAVHSAQAGDFARAWRELTPFLDDVGDREVALAFATVLGLDPSYPEALRVAERVVTAWGKDARVVIALAAGLVRVAELRPADEPPFEQGPAHLAAAVCQSCFEELGSAERTDPEIGGYLQLNLADALRMMGPDYDDEALKAYKLALTIDDTKGGWWFHLGLLHKWRGRFREGLEANRKALVRLGEQKPVLWNLAICATALGEGKLALEAWEKLGIKGEITKAGMPYVPDMPPMQVRVATMGEDVGRNDPLPPQAVTFEVLWVQPLSPCHGVVQSPTARRATVDYGDVVLWDGAPVRINTVEGRPVPVFPLLWILRAGDERRLRFVGMQKTKGLVEALAKELGEGTELVVFDERASPEGHLFYGKLIVAADRELASVREALERGIRARAGLTLSVPRLYELLGDTQAAGKAHQAWAGIERSAQKQGLLPPRG